MVLREQRGNTHSHIACSCDCNFNIIDRLHGSARVFIYCMSVLGEDVGGLAHREVVEHNHLIALMEESLCKVGADKSCSSCDEYFLAILL